VPLVVHGRPAQRGDSERVVYLLADRLPLGVSGRPRFLKALIARLLGEAGDPVHGPVERLGLVPLSGPRRPVPNLGDAVRIDGQLISGRPLGTQGPLVDGAFGVAFDVDDAIVAHRYQLSATDGAIGTD